MKMTKRIVSILLIAMMLLVMTACGGGNPNADKIIGKWETTMDLTETMNTQFTTNPAFSQFKDYLTLEDFKLKMYFEFKADGTYATTFDEATVNTSLDNLLAALKTAIKGYLQAIITSQGASITVEQLLEAQNNDLDTMVNSSFNREETIKAMTSGAQSGKYEVKGNQLFLSKTPDGAIDKSSCEYITIEGDTMQFTLPEGVEVVKPEGLDNLDIKAFYPLTLKRVA